MSIPYKISKMKNDRKKTTVPRDIRKEALEAIKYGSNLEAVVRANAVADQINRVSYYEIQVRAHAVWPFELI